jgi:hypothetical protein
LITVFTIPVLTSERVTGRGSKTAVTEDKKSIAGRAVERGAEVRSRRGPDERRRGAGEEKRRGGAGEEREGCPREAVEEVTGVGSVLEGSVHLGLHYLHQG